MPSKHIIVFLFILFFTPLTALAAETLSAYEIIEKSEQKHRGLSIYEEAGLEIIRPGWQRKMSMKSWGKGRDYALVLITAPARDKGTASLKRKREMWNWLPGIERVIKIAPSMLGQSWMGSDFTNDDLINQFSILVDYTHELSGEETLEGIVCWKITATPKPEAPVVWSKQILWISQDEFNYHRIEFYDELNELITVQRAYALKNLGGRRIPSVFEMLPQDKPGNKTVMTLHKAEFDFEINEDFFSLDRMKTVR